MSGEAWAAIGTVIAALLALIGVIYGNRLGKRGAERTAAAQERATLITPYSQALKDLNEELERQRKESDRARKLADEDRRRAAEDRERIAALEETTDELTQRLERAEDRYRIALRFIREHLAWVQRLPGAHDAPPIPAVLKADLDT